MSEIKIKEAPVVKPQIKIDTETKQRLQSEVSEESQVIVHCSCEGGWDKKIRIWRSTFLYAKGSTHRSKLLHAENITFYPTWMNVERGETKYFTLIFSGLPKGCKVFDLVEEIPERGGFEVRNMVRNDSDVYAVEV